ncbi:ribonuclease E/G [Denitrobaculum tricleocarpae]|uniref:Ribonuclease E/G n=1 Tax=Denitrobaculum tricleocarpae TaxID=2591009 RepID=A0A545TB40_9PROT|nr:ribonuclease E/G [Denitrobaculum tricleocarpae]TQV74427.1 ribonuclease E/G [Denitrobaculum tricleocarpae]
MSARQERPSGPVRILISRLPGEVRVAALREERLEDLLILRDDRPRVLGNIYLGRVQEISTGLEAAFIDIGLPRPGLLPRGEAPGKKQLGHALSEGDTVTVKVVREAGEDKGVRLTARIHDPPAGLEASASDADCPSLLTEGADPLLALIARQNEIEAIVVDDSGFCRDLAMRLEAAGMSGAEVTYDPALRPLFEREGVEEQIDALLYPLVELPGGGSLLIEPVRTLTAIDVNLGAMATSGTAQNQALEVNLKAMTEIARQLRLRAVAGLIVVDCLEMRDKKARDQVVASLRLALKDDDQPCQVMGMSPSGLLEMTRRRAGPTLAELLTEPGGEEGSGRQRDAATLAYEALRLALREAEAAPGSEILVKAPDRVVQLLRKGQVAKARSLVEKRLGQGLQLECLQHNPEKDGYAALPRLEVLAVQR